MLNRLQRFFLSFWATVVVAFAVSTPATAYAGEVKFGTEPLETDDQGKITSAGRKAATTTIPSMPGEELWPLHLWAKLDKGAPGPLYVEFFGKLPNGKPYLAYRHEYGEYDGEKFLSLAIELEGNQGFNKGKTYEVDLSQLSESGKNIQLASGQITLEFTEPEPVEEEAAAQEEGDTDGEPPEGSSAQDAIDTLVGGEESEANDQGPPPVEPPAKKKGCAVDRAEHGWVGILVVFLLGWGGFVRRRRHRA